MLDIVESLNALKGVRHAAIYKQGQLTHHQLTEAQQASLIKSSAVISQIFSAAEAIGKSHDEIFIGVDSGYLAGFRLHAGYVALLITEKKINFPLISMGVKSASESIKQMIEEEQAEAARIAAYSASATNAPSQIPTDESLRPVFESYTKLLTMYVGPAAEVLVEDAIETWKETYLQRPQNLPFLVALLEEELESPQERQSFADKAAEVALPTM